MLTVAEGDTEDPGRLWFPNQSKKSPVHQKRSKTNRHKCCNVGAELTVKKLKYDIPSRYPTPTVKAAFFDRSLPKRPAGGRESEFPRPTVDAGQEAGGGPDEPV